MLRSEEFDATEARPKRRPEADGYNMILPDNDFAGSGLSKMIRGQNDPEFVQICPARAANKPL